MKTVVGTVIYPSVIPYLGDFLKSLQNQTNKRFDILIINDGVETSFINAKLRKYRLCFEIINNTDGLSPPELRTMLLLESKKRSYDLLIMGDSDDFFSEDRIGCIASSAEADQESTFFYNTLLDTNNHRIMPNLPEHVKNIRELADYNFLGISNTAIRICCLEREYIQTFFKCKLPVYDWYLFSRLLIDQHKGLFVPNAVTYYRFHENNLVGKQHRNSKSIEKEINTKIQHYGLLKELSEEMINKYNAYTSGAIVETPISNFYYWWNYTREEK